MTTLRQLRKAAGDLPEVTEHDEAGKVAFHVAGRLFVVVDGGDVRLRMSATEVAGTLGDLPSATAVPPTGVASAVEVALADVNGMQLNALVRRAWAHRAPARLTEASAAAEQAADQGAGDLPAAVGRPALRALHGAGLHTLDDVARFDEARLLALHGVGPKAVAVLRRALAERGRPQR